MASEVENYISTQIKTMAQFIAAMEVLSSLPLSEAKLVISRITDPDVRQFVLSMLEHIHKNSNYTQWLLRDK
jgi:hypothetical protein